MDKPKKPRKRTRRPRVAYDRKLLECIACLTWGGKGWKPSRDVVEALRALGHDFPVQAVVAAQKRAVEEGLVTVLLNLDHEIAEVHRLEPLLQERFRDSGIKRFCLVPGDPAMMDELKRERLQDIHAQVTQKLACRAASYAHELLDAAAGRKTQAPFRIGVAWGRTLHLFAEQLPRVTPGALPADVKVYPIVGITDAERALPIEANTIAADVARALRGRSAQLQCPAIVRSDQYDVATRLDQVQRTLTVIREELDLVFTGMGPIEHAEDADDIAISPDPEFNKELFQSARGASGEMCFWCFRDDGQPVTDLPYRSIGLELDGLRRIASDANGRRVVLITGGDKRRIPPLKAAIKGRLVSDVVTDTITARALLGEFLPRRP